MRFLGLALFSLFLLFYNVSAQAQDCTGQEGTILYNSAYQVFQGCQGDQWVAFHEPQCPAGDGCSAPAGPTGCDNIGDTCDDGAIYAGSSPDGNVKMYTTPADAPSTYSWNDGTLDYQDTGMENCTDAASPGTAASCYAGEANTAFLVGATGEPDYPFAAAEYCNGLSVHGHGDWYLPAMDEVAVLYANRNASDLSGSFSFYYWSSSEGDTTKARIQSFSSFSPGQGSFDKQIDTVSVRCVRR